MSTHAVDCTASPERLWALIARPDRWSEWSPHVRGGEGLGSPEVREGARGSVVLRGGLRLAAEITKVTPGHSWAWRVGGLKVRHRIEPTERGSRLEMAVEAANGGWSPAAIAYAPLVGLIARNIARVAEREGS
jgi:uncharacterized protein YndB with AHSA1/START domain